MNNDFNFYWHLSDLASVISNNCTVFSCFSGAGGSSLGYKLAGYDVIGHLDIDPRMVELYRLNLNPTYSYCEDIRDFKLRRDLPDALFNLDILDGSPPCSLFSNSNLKADSKKGKKTYFREGQKAQVLDDLFFEFLDLADRLKPKIIVMENVQGLLAKKNRSYVDKVFRLLSSMGYAYQANLLDAAIMGVPQRRKRVFFVAVRKDLAYPSFGFNRSLLALQFHFNNRATFDMIKRDYKGGVVSDVVKELLVHYRKGDTGLRDVMLRLKGKEARFDSSFLLPGRPCPTYTTKNSHFCLESLRHLSTYELSQAFSFPVDYDFNGLRGFYELGMSVPPLMIANISSVIFDKILFNS